MIFTYCIIYDVYNVFMCAYIFYIWESKKNFLIINQFL